MDTHTPMTIACRDTNEYVIQLLIDKGASVNYVKGASWSPLFALISSYRTSKENGGSVYPILELLLENGADPNFSMKNNYPLLILYQKYINSYTETRKEYPEAVKLLIKYGADVHVGNVIDSMIDNFDVDTLNFLLKNSALTQQEIDSIHQKILELENIQS